MTSTNGASSDDSKPKVSMRFNENDKSFDAYVHDPHESRPRKVPRTKEEIDEAFPVPIVPPAQPDSFSQDTLQLYKKAIEDAGSLTEKERLSVLDWVPEAEVYERCRKNCGITWHELVTKAAERPKELTSDEALFVTTGRFSTYGDAEADNNRVFGKLMLPEELRNLWINAQKAATDPRYGKAQANADKASLKIQQERDEALSHLSSDDQENIRVSTRIPWIVQLTESTKPHWGFVCFRTAYDNDEAWEKYKEHLLRCSRTGLWVLPGTDLVSKRWKIEFIDDKKAELDNAGLEDLCNYFNKPPPSFSLITSCVSSGLRSDAFLFADSRTIASLNDPPCDPSLIGVEPARGAPPFSTEHLLPGYTNVVDASFDPTKTYTHGFKGIIKVHPAHIATTFYHRVKARGEKPEPGSKQWWNQKMDWEKMYMRANGSMSRPGGVYPPMWTYNR